ncbi:M48 family metallopeptidase [Phenylobacterium sp.]|uniref:M48 family metallopeptidase n=1 Tax=Phenylobacterium sp. TaxID=1871053 RepID=UPI0027304EFC|nr:M48 family metallopeptidase [Phenylobacterium sp.]MDP1618475.1 M48 family metalloprotease [Phenylobacterium sp.]MDP1989188.1 M48 family metalloprotease [Phenylobacterium sp.]
MIPPPESVEAGYWDLMAKAERQAQQSGELNKDPALNAYVREVTCKVAVEYCDELRLYIMDRPFMNATMAPNGFGEVWSGLLLRVEDEAGLAFVLGHEVSHYAESHSVEAALAHKNRQNIALAVSIGVAAVGVYAAASVGPYGDPGPILDATGNLIDAVYLASVTAFFRFSREHETEADLLGFQRAAAAGYRPQAAAESWRVVMAETSASDFERVRKRDARLGVFDSHPLHRDRVVALEAEAAKLTGEGVRGRERYRAAIRPHLAAWLKDDLRRRDFGQTLHLLGRLETSGEDLGVINFYRGEAYRLRRQLDDLERAEAAYFTASVHSDAPVAVWRELGDLRRRRNAVTEALTAYETYLAQAPTAEDAWIVQDAVASLKKGLS